jgi:hypothetical protein
MSECGENYVKKDLYLLISDVSSDEMMIKMMMDEKMGMMTVIIIRTYHAVYAGWNSTVDIATRYGLDGPWLESRWGATFSALIPTGSEAHQASYARCTASFAELKRPGRGVDHPPPSSADVKERVELYLYSPSGPSWPVLG